MLHEILLGLSGHPSPLLEPELLASQQDAGNLSDTILTASERQLLNNIGSLARLHRQLRQHLERVCKEHDSVICRAIANSIRQVHLDRFQKKVLAVEASILSRDASTVAAYNIVPLAHVVGQFSDWHRKMAWYWNVANYMVNAETGQATNSGASIINKLRSEAQTGFPEIEEIAKQLSKVAEVTWLRQLASWVLYGSLPQQGKHDFFVQVGDNNGYHISKQLMPQFVSEAAAKSLLFIGTSLTHVQQNHTTAMKSKLLETLSKHTQALSCIEVPISSTEFNHTVTRLRTSLSQNVLQALLPQALTTTTFSTLQKYFLLSNSDFATSLINAAEQDQEARWRNTQEFTRQNPLQALQGLKLKDGETNKVLRQALKIVARTASEHDDEVLDFASKHITFTTTTKLASRPSTADSAFEDRIKLSTTIFKDLCFGTPATLHFQISSPLELILSSFDIGIYSAIHGYLIALRRAQLRLEGLWRQSFARRHSNRVSSRSSQHNRKVWASCSAVLLLLAECLTYLSSNVITPSCDRLNAWMATTDAGHKDPETIAAGHRVFLDSLAYDLLLTDVRYTTSLRALLGNVDLITSLFIRVLEIQSNSIEHLAEDSNKAQADLDRACHDLDIGMRNVINRLQQIHQDRVGSSRYFEIGKRYTGGFEPYSTGGLDHLLMKLEYHQQ